MKNPDNDRLEKLEALVEKGFDGVRAELKELRRQIDVRDEQNASFLLLLKYAYSTLEKALFPKDEK
jgi:hypothetical protein